MARLAAEHGIHASFIGSYMKATPYSAGSMALTPAFTPQQVLRQGNGATMMDVGMLGQYIPSSCAPLPPAPCGGNVTIGMINAMLTGAGGVSGSTMNGNGSMSGSSYGSGSSNSGTSGSGSSGVGGSMTGKNNSSVQFTGVASSKQFSSVNLVSSIVIAVAAALL